MTEEEYRAALTAFVAGEFMQGECLVEGDSAEPHRTGPGIEETLTPDTPLVESGILDSLRIAVLLHWIRDELGVHVPLEKIDAGHFADIATIAGMLAGAPAQEAAV